MTGVLMKSGNVYEVTVGETVEIRCSYPEDHKYTPKYFCRHPCKSSEHVLIKSEKVDQVDSAGRYSLINFVNGLFISVTIKHLRLTDSGVYYCGLDQWFRDTLKKVVLSVYPAPVNGSTHTSENTHVTSTWTTALTWTVNLSSTVQWTGSTPPVNNSSASMTLVCTGVLLSLGFWILVASVCIYNTRSDAKSKYTAQDPPDFNQAVDNVCTIVVYSLDDPTKEDCSSLNCSTVLNYSGTELVCNAITNYLN
ncbi:CMRF35-like molecule 5 isoform X2 [Puntigrus tetrazona]|nr:CMRF35-like molecule 5 isoform X2 [Puntigrus tetrazona]XP_043102140.1 CMRF35-like molecule 5 isoform X2 [Puntigrus tetrazona]